ncbi:MAG TPA: T9SS type A sorting domain-containing protein [Bacteroidia bacterium]|nr:T9SS type A sorting domain-containing protein [Bacteroidia bacterium]
MRKRYALILPAAVLAVSLSAQNSWEKKTSFGDKRARAVAFSIGTRGYLATGEDTADAEKNDLWEYDPGTDSWTQKASLPATGRRDAVGFSIGNKGYVGTGIDASEAFLGNTLDDFWEYSPQTNAWTQKAPYPGNFGYGIYFATAFTANGKGYVCCGKIGASNYSQELWEFNPSTNSWTQKAFFPGGVRYGQMSFSLNGKGYVGCGTDENWFTNDFWEYNPVSDTWTQKADFPGSKRSFGTAFSIGQKGYMGLGTDGGYSNDLFEYDPIDNSWAVKASYGGEGRRSAPSFVLTGAAYVMTGKGTSGKHRDNWEYQPYVTGIDESETVAATVFPDPASDYLCFSSGNDFSGSGNMTIAVFSADGREVLTAKKAAAPDCRIDVSGLAAGMYSWIITSESGKTANGKFEIQR